MPVPARYLFAFTGGGVRVDRLWRSVRLWLRWSDLDRCYGSLRLSAIEIEWWQFVRFRERRRPVIDRGRGRCSRASSYRSRPSTGPQRKQCAQEQQTNKGEPNGSRHRNHFAVPGHLKKEPKFPALRRLLGGSAPSLDAAQQARHTSAAIHALDHISDNQKIMLAPSGKSVIKG